MLQSLKRVMLVLLAVLALGGAAQAEDVTFTGLVAYRERMALPPGAALAISLVSLPDQRLIAGAHAWLDAKANSPIQFTLNVRSTVLAAGGSYGLVAEIRSEGRTIFSNGQPVVVDPLAPSGILIPVQFSPPPPHDPPIEVLPLPEAPNPLLDVVWSVTSIGGDPVLPGSGLTFSIAADYRVGGHGGCNNYFAEASFDVPPLSFGPVAGTRMACAPAVMAQEARFFTALGATVGYEVAGDTLKLFDAAGVPLVGLVRSP